MQFFGFFSYFCVLSIHLQFFIQVDFLSNIYYFHFYFYLFQYKIIFIFYTIIKIEKQENLNEYNCSLIQPKKGELNKFLSSFYNTNLELENSLTWQKKYANPVELAEIIGIYVDNSDNYSLFMWICLDKNVFIQITSANADDVIKYLYERFPY